MKLEGDRIGLKWDGREVLVYKGSTDKIRQKIPGFKRAPFGTRDAKNKYLDVIIRQPLKNPRGKMMPADDEAHIPIAIVSKRYGLLRHRKLFRVLETALEEIISDSLSLEAELMITEYGERMQVSFLLLHHEFDPGDGYPLLLKVNALNSVDRSTSLDINMTWYRHESETSLIYRMEEEFRMRHVKSLTPQTVGGGFLSKQLRLLSVEHNLYRKWYRTKRSQDQVERWISETVKKKWGTETADRVLRIAEIGLDEGGEEVPKIFAPVQNLYHLSQVLSWVAKWAINREKKKPKPLRQRTFDAQLERMMEIPALMDDLLAMEESPTQIEF